jgi:hypothetical protein
VEQLALIASREQYRHHLEPVYAALPARYRGNGHSSSALVSSASDLTLALRQGYRRLAYLEHGIGQPYSGALGYPGGPGRQHVGLFLSPNETAAAADRTRYPEAHVVLVGDPRLDTLPEREPGPLRVAVSFHWQCDVCPESRSALAWYRRALPELARVAPLLGHGHPRAARELERLWTGMGVVWEPSWDEVLRRADVYVCDNSSTLYEFASTGRPVVVLNAPWYRREVSHGLRFWQAANVGVQVHHPDELAAAVELALEDRPEQQAARQAALRLAYAHPTGAARRAARALMGWLS